MLPATAAGSTDPLRRDRMTIALGNDRGALGGTPRRVGHATAGPRFHPAELPGKEAAPGLALRARTGDRATRESACRESVPGTRSEGIVLRAPPDLGPSRSLELGLGDVFGQVASRVRLATSRVEIDESPAEGSPRFGKGRLRRAVVVPDRHQEAVQVRGDVLVCNPGLVF